MGPDSTGRSFITNLWPYSTFSSLSTPATSSTSTSTSSRYRPQAYHDEVVDQDVELNEDEMFWNEDQPQSHDLIDLDSGVSQTAGRGSRLSQSDSTSEYNNSEQNQRSITPLFGLRSPKSVLHYNFTNLIDQHDTSDTGDSDVNSDDDSDDPYHNGHTRHLDYVDNEEIYSLSIGYNNPIMTHESRPMFSSSQPPSTSRLTDLIRLFSIGGSKSAPTTPEPPAELPDEPAERPVDSGTTSDTKTDPSTDVQARSWFSWWRSKAATSSSSGNKPKEIPMQTIQNGIPVKIADDSDQTTTEDKNKKLNKKKKKDASGELNDKFEIYTVQNSKETLNSIAARFHTTPAQIKHLNRLTMDCVFVGQILQIPSIVPKRLSDKLPIVVSNKTTSSCPSSLSLKLSVLEPYHDNPGHSRAISTSTNIISTPTTDLNLSSSKPTESLSFHHNSPAKQNLL